MTALPEKGCQNLRRIYDDAWWSFSEGLATVIKDGKWFHILHNGKPAYEERYDWVGSFSEGLARVSEDGKEFHILHNGKPAYEERYDWVDSFSEGLAPVRKGEEYFHIRPDGTRV